MNGEDPRRLIMRAAVAAGGSAAALMSYSLTSRDESEIRAAASQCLDPLLRAVVHAIDAAGERLPGDSGRRLRTAIGDHLELGATVEPGSCRICGCTEANACVGIPVREGVFQNCSWTDESRTLCNNPECLRRAAVEPLLEPETLS